MRTTQEHEEEQLMNAAKKATAWNLFVAMITVVTINSIPVSAQEATASGMYEERLAKAVELLEKREFSAAAKAYRKANELAGGASAEALLGFATACYQTQRYSKSLDTARRVLELSNEQSIRMAAYHLLGLSLFESADGDRIRLEEAEQAFRKVIELSDGEKYGLYFRESRAPHRDLEVICSPSARLKSCPRE